MRVAVVFDETIEEKGEPMIAFDEHRVVTPRDAAEDWWDGLDGAVLECLHAEGPMAPGEIGRRLGISEESAASLVSLLAREGKVRISRVEVAV